MYGLGINKIDFQHINNCARDAELVDITAVTIRNELKRKKILKEISEKLKNPKKMDEVIDEN